MLRWQIITAIIIIAFALLLLALAIINLCYYASRRRTRVAVATPPPQVLPRTSTSNNWAIAVERSFRWRYSSKPLFSWADHPQLVRKAFENGWPGFAFTGTHPSYLPITGASVDLGGPNQTGTQIVEISWVLRDDSNDFMQNIRMNNPELSKNILISSMYSSSSTAVKSAVWTALPLPGPSIGNSFPQEAYFEITIVEKNENLDGKINHDSETTTGNETGKGHNSEEVEHGIIGGKRKNGVVISLGLTSSTFESYRIPGTYRGSVGFNSNGALNLDGRTLIFESEESDWGQQGKVVGCGFNPKQKRVFFTLDSELTHLVDCKSEEFGSPLHPVLAANTDITVLVNLGQSRFSYEPANATRTPNPNFMVKSAGDSTLAVGFDDSEELFSMGRIDPEWLKHCIEKDGKGDMNNRNSECGGASDESDLFEIVLDSNARSQSVLN